MKNEPVAWLLFRDGGESYPEYTTSYKQMREWETYLGDNERIEPHYTHLAKPIDKPDECISGCPENQTCDYCAGIKTLTAEEIRQTAVECGAYINEDTGSLYPDDMCVGSFARAILRKASEK